MRKKFKSISESGASNPPAYARRTVPEEAVRADLSAGDEGEEGGPSPPAGQCPLHFLSGGVRRQAASFLFLLLCAFLCPFIPFPCSADWGGRR